MKISVYFDFGADRFFEGAVFRGAAFFFVTGFFKLDNKLVGSLDFTFDPK